MPTIALALIVKNEAPTIAITLESARKALGPGPTLVVDTGSTDKTVDVVTQWAQVSGHKYGGVVTASRPFDDFGSARTSALNLAFEAFPACDHVAMVDAGVTVDGTLERHAYDPTKPPCFTAKIRLGALEYERPQVFPRGWRYVGRVHEYAEGPGKLCASGLTFAYNLEGSRPESARAQRWLRDLTLLEEDSTPRGKFYYAQTLECLGRKSQALRAYIRRYEDESGYTQERVVAMLRCIKLAGNYHDAERFAQAALQLDGSRGEAWLELCARVDEWKPSPQRDSLLIHLANCAIRGVPRKGALFVDLNREWRANVYAADTYSNQGRFDLAAWHWRRALEVEGGRMPAEMHAQLMLALKLNGGEP